jgi:hypothetical protein
MYRREAVTLVVSVLLVLALGLVCSIPHAYADTDVPAVLAMPQEYLNYTVTGQQRRFVGNGCNAVTTCTFLNQLFCLALLRIPPHNITNLLDAVELALSKSATIRQTAQPPTVIGDGEYGLLRIAPPKPISAANHSTP